MVKPPIQHNQDMPEKPAKPVKLDVLMKPVVPAKPDVTTKPHVPAKPDVQGKSHVPGKPDVPARPKINAPKPCITHDSKSASGAVCHKNDDSDSYGIAAEEESLNLRSQIDDGNQQSYLPAMGSVQDYTNEASMNLGSSLCDDLLSESDKVVQGSDHGKGVDYAALDSSYSTLSFEESCGSLDLLEEDYSRGDIEREGMLLPNAPNCSSVISDLQTLDAEQVDGEESDVKEGFSTSQEDNADLSLRTDVAEDLNMRINIPKPRRPPPPRPPKISKVHTEFDKNCYEIKENVNDLESRLSNDVFSIKAVNVSSSGHENMSGNMSKELEQNKIDGSTNNSLEQDAINPIVCMKGDKDFLEAIPPLKELVNDKREEEKMDGRHKIPFLQNQTRNNNRYAKGGVRSCSAPDSTIGKVGDSQDRIEHKWKGRSSSTNLQAPVDFESKSELQKRFKELHKRSEEKSDATNQAIVRKELPTVADDIDEEMEDTVFFDYVLVVKLREGENGLEPHISFRFPPKQQYDKEIDPRLASIPQFCFPDLKNGMSTADYLEQHVGFSSSETFSFVLTDMVGKRHFGFCRQIQVKKSTKRRKDNDGLPEVYCIVSPYGLFGLYAQILDEVERQCSFSSSSAFVFLKAVLSHSLPKAGGSIKVSFYSGSSGGLSSYTLKRESDSVLHEHVDLNRLFAKLPVLTITYVVCALLLERRIILVSSQLSLLSSCCHGFVSLLYPFTWQHTYIPVLPFSLVDMCCLPTPYLLGILSGCLDEIKDLPIDEAIIVDLDNGKILRQDDQQKVKFFPSHIENHMESSLERVLKSSSSDAEASKERNMMFNDIFSDAYLNLIGNFKDYCTHNDEDQFQGANFYRASKSKESKKFLKEFIKTQAFHQFIRQYGNDSNTKKGLFHKKLHEWEISRKNKGTESAWTRFKGKLKVGHR